MARDTITPFGITSDCKPRLSCRCDRYDTEFPTGESASNQVEICFGNYEARCFVGGINEGCRRRSFRAVVSEGVPIAIYKDSAEFYVTLECDIIAKGHRANLLTSGNKPSKIIVQVSISLGITSQFGVIHEFVIIYLGDYRVAIGKSRELNFSSAYIPFHAYAAP